MKVTIDMKVDVDDEQFDYVAMTSIVDAVCEVFKVHKRELMGKNRMRYLTHARFAVCYLGWLFTKRSLPSIGRFMERDHTTIMHGRNRAIELMREKKNPIDGTPHFKELLEASKQRAFEIEREKKNELSEIKNDVLMEVQSQIDKKVDSIRKTGYLSGDEVVFSCLNADR